MSKKNENMEIESLNSGTHSPVQQCSEGQHNIEIQGDDIFAIDNDSTKLYQNVDSKPQSSGGNNVLSESTFDLESAQDQLIQDLLKEKRSILEILSNSKQVAKKKKKQFDIDSDGGFAISDEEGTNEEDNQGNNQAKSVSTNATVENVNFMLDNIISVTFDQIQFENPKVRKYCKKVSKLMRKFYQEVFRTKSKLDFPFITFLSNFFLVNHLEQAEFEIFFSFTQGLFDVPKKQMCMTQAAFSYLFYEIILRMEYSRFNSYSYNTMENCILFINSYLGILNVDLYDNITLRGPKRIIGLEAVLNLHLNTRTSSILHTSSLTFLNKIILTQVENTNEISNFIKKEFLDRVIDILEDDMAMIAQEPNKALHICNVISYLQKTFTSIHQRLKRLDLINQRNQEINNLIIDTPDSQHIQPDIAQGSELQNRLMRQITLKINNHTFMKTPSKFEVTISRIDKVRDLKHKIMEKLTAFGENNLSLMCYGKHLYNPEKTLFEFKVKDNAEVIVLENEIGGEFDIQSDMMGRHNSKCSQAKAMFPDVPEDLISYILLSKSESLEESIMALASDEKEKLRVEFTEVEAIKNKSQKVFATTSSKGPSSNAVPSEGSKEKILIDSISSYDRLYDTIVKIAKIEHEELKGLLWNLINYLPPSMKLTKMINDEFFSEPSYAHLGTENDNSVKTYILENPDKIMSYFYFTIIGQQLKKCIDERNVIKLTEFFVNQNGHLLINILTLKFETICTELYDLIDLDLKAAQSGEQTMKVKKLSLLIPLLNIMQLFYNLALGYSIEESKYLKFGNKLKYLEFRNFLDQGKEFNPLLQSYGWDTLSEITSTIILDEKLDSFFYKLISKLLTGIQKNTLNFNDNPIVNNIVSYIFVLLEKRAQVYTQLGMGFNSNTNLLSESNQLQNYSFLEQVTDYLSEGSEYLNSNNIMGNLFMVHLAWNKNLIPLHFEKLLKLVISRGFFEKIPKTLLLIINVIGEHLSKVELNLFIKSKNSERNQEILREYFSRINSLPQITSLTEENFNKIIPQNFEGIIDILKIQIYMIQKLKENQVELDIEQIDNMYASIIEPNISQLFSEVPTFFSKCISKGETSLKNKFFEICLMFCKIDSKYLFKLLTYITSVYKKEDFENNGYQMVDIRNQDFIGLKNLGCTCYANSLFQQLFHNEQVQRELMVSEPNSQEESQIVLFQVKKLFWRLKFTKMNYTFLNDFCQVFTSFDGLPVNVRVQQDVSEFFSLLVDNLENQLKISQGDNKNSIFKKQFGGVMVNIIESLEQDHPYTRERTEPFFQLSIPIKNSTNFDEALNEFCSEEYFRDDNKLHIEKYDMKINVSKKIMLKKLPPTMIFNLKRFEYDVRSFQRYKLNDFFDFPEEIDLKNWIHHSESTEERYNGSTKYRLKGVLIHSGSASAGHYYSHIKLNGKWFEFNDTNVREFAPTPEIKHQQWFGSGKTAPGGGFLASNSTSAYMLFYERIDEEITDNNEGNKSMQMEETPLELAKEGKEMYAEIEKENKLFIRQKIFVDGVSIRFIDGLLDTLDDPGFLDEVEALLLNDEKTEVKNHSFLDIMVARNATILHKMSNRHKFLEEFLPNDPILLEFANDLMTPIEVQNEKSNSIMGIFGMDDDDVARGPIIHEGGNNYGFDSFDKGIQESGKQNILDQGFVLYQQQGEVNDQQGMVKDQQGEVKNQPQPEPDAKTKNWQLNNILLGDIEQTGKILRLGQFRIFVYHQVIQQYPKIEAK